MKILVCGDIVGRSGREVIENFLPELVCENDINFVIVNGENSASGFGITKKICEHFVKFRKTFIIQICGKNDEVDTNAQDVQ